MTDYSKMSDYEISCEVGRAISFVDYLLARNGQKNYCNSWADAGPIAEKNLIGVVPAQSGWCATSDEVEHEGMFFVDKDPCRAICIVFLMMNEGE